MKRIVSLLRAVVLLAVILSLVVACSPAAPPAPTAAPATPKPVAPAPAAPTAAPAVPTAAPAAPAPAAPTKAPAAAAGPSVLRAGALLPMTGDGAHYGKWMSQGALLAMEEINSAGGLDGAKLELIIEDHKSGQAKEAAAGMQKLAEIDKAPYVLTSYSAVTLAAQPIAAEKKIVLLNGGGYSPDLLNKSYLYNTKLLTSSSAQAAAEYVFNQFGVRKMGSIFNADASGIATQNYMRGIWEKMGGKVVAEESHAMGATDFSTQLAKLKQGGPDLLAIWSIGGHIGRIAKQAREMGINAQIIAVEWSPEESKVGGQAVDGMVYAVDGLDVDSKEAITQNFVKNYKGKYNMDAEYISANYYDAITLYFELLKGAKTKGGNWYSGEALRDVLVTKRSFPSVYGGQQTFRDDGSVTKPMMLFQVKDAKPVKLKTVTVQ